ncbi:MAG: type IV pilus assembly protein PilM [Nitrospirota bacterium]
MFFSKQQQIIGLDIGSSNIKCVQLKEGLNGYKLQKLGLKDLGPEIIVEGTIMDAARVIDLIKDILSELNIKTKDVAISVSGHSVIVKKITLPTMTEDELEESIRWEAEQYIPFDINDVNIDFYILDQSEEQDGRGQMNVLLVAVKKDKLNEYISVVSEAGLNPVIVDVDAFTIENMFGINYETSENEIVALVNIGASVMNINILKNGIFSFSRDISIGGNRYTESIQKDLHLSYEDAERAKKGEDVEGITKDTLGPIIDAVNIEVVSEIVRSFDYFKTTSNQEHIDKILLSGGSSKLEGLADFLSDRLGTDIELTDPFKKIEVDPASFDIDYIKDVAPFVTVGLGLAIRKIGDR